MKQILLNASQREEVRLAIVENKNLVELDIDLPSKNIKSNIYKGTISRVEPGLEAAFVNFGRTRHGFLPFKEISPEIFVPGKPRTIRDCIESGREVVVQVDKEERGTKGAALTTYLKLAGKYLVLLPKNPNTGGISRRLEGDDRLNAKKMLDAINIPEKMSVILRTSGLNTTKETLEWDMNYLIQIYENIIENSVLKKAPYLVYEESSMLARIIRDYIDDETDSIVIDDQVFYDDFMNAKKYFIPHSKIKIEQYKKSTPLFSEYRIETQVQSVYRRKISLPSGGNIVFDSTEALTSVDVNSAKSTKGGDIEETALNTNLEAAVSLSTQLKLRDIGGLIVVDFIDMMSINSQKTVMRKMAELAKIDKAKIQFSRISKFGLMEISRQKLRASIIDNTDDSCPTCSGSGYIKSLSSQSISLVRMLEEEAVKSDKPITVYLPVRLATYLLNEKRDLVQGIEERHKISIKIVPDPDVEVTSYLIDRENRSPSDFKASVSNKDSSRETKITSPQPSNYKAEKPLVSAVAPKTQPPKPRDTNYAVTDGIFISIIKKIKSIFATKEKRTPRFKNNNRKRYSRSYNPKYNKYKSFNKKKHNSRRSNTKPHNQ